MYGVFGVIWIYFSSRGIINTTNDPSEILQIERVKGYIFIGVTMLLLYLTIKQENDVRNMVENNILKIVNIIESTQDAVIGKDLNGLITSWNNGAEKIFGYSSGEIIGAHISIIFPNNKHHLVPIILSKLKLGENVDNFQTPMISKLGEEIFVSITMSPIKNTEDEIVGISTIAANITKQKSDEKRLEQSYQELSAVYEQISAVEEELRAKYEELQQMAYYDSVTSLPNRTMFMERLNEELLSASNENRKGAVFFLDLDDFKKINDTLGHDYGDGLLKQIGKLLSQRVRDIDIVARFGGDEYLILLPDIHDCMEAVNILKEILNIFNQPFLIDEKQVFVTASIGVIIYPDDGNTAGIVLKNVDTAMYAAKRNGRNRYCFFDKKISTEVLRRSEIEKGLRQAFQKNEISIYYQPQVNIKTKNIVGLEALIRWKSYELGVVTPAEFIPVAEDTGLITCIGEWVLREACMENKRLKEKGYKFGTISVNVSAIQLQNDFLKVVENTLDAVGLEPQYLEIEITESILMKSLEENVKILRELRSIGIKTALDDFGTGYSSLSYLRMLPINTLKIDKSFIDDICKDDGHKDITDGIIQLAHKINLDVIIEGVETAGQVKLLQDMNCNAIQGYYFSAPVPVEELEILLEKGYFDI
jgi:diguanylate cyclase (GGDEF)-like protein/PAS domain S-box-containing protein